MHNLSKFKFSIFIFLLLSIVQFAYFAKGVNAESLNCTYSSFANGCQIQFGLSCSPGTHPEKNCTLDCKNEGAILCISDLISAPPPTPRPTDCTKASGSCQARSAPCLGSQSISPQCGTQLDSTGSQYICCKPERTPSPIVSEPPSSNGGSAFPEIKYPCDGDGLTPEFHSLRPYQAAHCGDANKAVYCSNELKFVEAFSNFPECIDQAPDSEGNFDCSTDPGNPSSDAHVEPHILTVTLDESMFPIMGNTEEVKNGNGGTEVFDDATKVNEYASWYLSGVNNRAEYGENTDDRVVNFSGPVQKLLPKMIQEAERIKTIKKATVDGEPWTDEDDGKTYTTPQNHDQVVVCGEKDGLLGYIGIGVTKPKPCYEAKEYRLSEWLDDLSEFNNFFNRIGADIWPKRTPPLPWDDGTVENPTKDNPAKPFASQALYQKAYKEWQGESCALIPLIDINLCIDNPFVPNKWAELYQYIPLSNTTDKKGAERVTDVQPHPDGGTVIDAFSYGEVRSAPLYFAHTQEVKETSELLNKTFTPIDCPVDENGKRIEDEKCELLKNTRGNIGKNSCSVVDIRVNKGDNLFPGDPDEIQVPEVTYDITQVRCRVRITGERCRPNQDPDCLDPEPIKKVTCHAEVTITLKTQSKTPNANEIFDSTVAGTGSTFRKIFPKIEAGAPVSCIADMPTVTDVTYTGTSTLKKGDTTFDVKRFPEDGAGDNPQLTFPHIGSVYEYFLKGIQTALRPKGYGEPITSGVCNNVKCGELPDLPKGQGSCSLGQISSRVGEIPQSLKDIVEAAGETYKVPPNLLLGIMFGESAFNPPTTGGGTGETGGVEWSDYNVKNWATCVPFPGCDPSSDVTKNVVWFATDEWKSTISDGIRDDLKKIDPNKQEPDGCNLLDAIYGLAWLSRDNVDGGPFAIPACFGINLNTGKMSDGASNSCSWSDNDYETVIKMWESGWTNECFTKDNSCATGGGHDAACPTGGDTCETNGTRWQSIPGYTGTSHNACVFDVAHGN